MPSLSSVLIKIRLIMFADPQISTAKFSNQKAGPPVPLPLEFPYLPYYMVCGCDQSGDRVSENEKRYHISSIKLRVLV